MVSRRNNDKQNHGRIAQPQERIDSFPPPRLPDLTLLQRPAEDAAMVDHGAADHKSVAEMHGRHGGKGVDVVAGHEDRGGIVAADGIEKAVFGREQAGRHARVEGES